MSGSPLLDVYRKMTGEQITRTSELLRNPAARTTRGTWLPVPGLLAKIDNSLDQFGEGLLRTYQDPDLHDQAKQSRVQEWSTATSAQVGADSSAVLERTNKILTTLKAAGYPARPGTPDAAQEAALQGLKTDLRMVFDNVAADDLDGRMSTALRRAVSDGDGLMTWLLASSPWSEMYLSSRGEDGPAVIQWRHSVATALDEMSPPEVSESRTLYRKLADPQSGLPVLDLLLGSTIGGVIQNIAEWRPSYVDPVPPTMVA